MSIQPQVSVIMSAYNTAAYIEEAIDSVLNQTVANVELIIVDDGSTDSTAEIISNRLSDQRVLYTKIVNSGSPIARNVGRKMARAPYIAFIDSDDLWPSHKLERQLDEISAGENSAVIGAVQRFIVDGNGEREFLSISYPPAQTSQSQYRDALLSLELNQMSCFNTLLAPTKIIQQFGLWDPNFVTAHDWENWLRLSGVLEFKTIEEPMYFYRKYPNSSTRKNSYRTALYYQCEVVNKYATKSFFGAMNVRCYKAIRYEPFINAALNNKNRFLALLIFLQSTFNSNLIFSRNGLRILFRILTG
jgi:glycosyltransferase involved in cell wall biosynthesis